MRLLFRICFICMDYFRQRMIKRLFFLLTISLLYLPASQAQQSGEPVRIRWQEALHVPVFDGAGYPDQDQPVPWYSSRIRAISHTGGKPVVRLTDTRYEPVPEEERHFYREGASSQHTIKTSMQTERKQGFIRLEFNPVRQNPVSGELERLLQFTPVISYEASTDSLSQQVKTKAFAERSVLAEGRWVKIAIRESGLYKVTYDQLRDLGLENPSQVSLFGNGGKQLPFDSGQERPDDLIENPVYLHTGTDGTFGSGDYLLFYAKGTDHWQYDAALGMFVHRLHQFSDEIYYFLTDTEGNRLRISTMQEPEGNQALTADTYDFYAFREKDSVNLIKSGRQWVWKHFNIRTEYDFLFDLGEKVPESPVHVLSSLLVRSTRAAANSSISLSANNNPITTLSFGGVNTGNYEALYATARVEKVSTQISGNSLLLTYRFIPSNPAAVGWIDYINIHTRSRLVYHDKPLHFRDIESVGDQQITEFTVSGASAGLQLWDVTSPGATHALAYRPSGAGIRFKAGTNELREFVLFDPEDPDIPAPLLEGYLTGPVENQNLHGIPTPDMVIIVQPELREQAEALAAIHQNHDGLQTAILEPETIYNEFSSGIQDPTAFRDLLRMLHERPDGNKLKYLLLFGDGTYNNKLLMTDGDYRNYLPTYQSLESLYPTRSYVTDDFFGLLDPGEDLINGLLDIGVGRFPVTIPYEAAIVVEKVRKYLSPDTFGDWRNLICFIGDDEDGNAHMRDANTLADLVDERYPGFNVDKIFLDAFQQVVTASGETYPEVNRAINDRISKGALIMNYLGHGSEKGLAHENILTSGDINSWTNIDKLPLFMTATCEFSRFDDHEFPSAGEDVLLNPSGGGIGLFTTTRLVYSSPNFRLNREFYNYAFEHVQGEKYRFGDLMRLTKNAIGSELNKLNFTLLADPAIKLNFPDQQVIMTHVNDQPVSEFTDTLKALSKVRVSGYISDRQNRRMEDFQGTVFTSVYDKEVNMTTLNNDGGVPMDFRIQNNILFKGKSSIRNGAFDMEFIVPKDIGYSIGPGRFSFYATNGETDGAGVNRNIRIGGSTDSLIRDEKGPQVRLFMNDTTFVYGGTTSQNPVLLAHVLDENGINTTGNGIGHDITAILDDNNQNIIVLNDYYESNLDDYRGGSIRYPLANLEPGKHEITLKVWDILNNSTETELQFEVFSSEQIQLRNLINYPNPFTTRTAFYFEHNQAGTAMDAQIQIYTVSGRLVKSFDFLSATETQVEAGQYRVGPVYWDGTDQFGDRIGRGTYFYRVRIRTPNGTAEAFQKLVKL